MSRVRVYAYQWKRGCNAVIGHARNVLGRRLSSNQATYFLLPPLLFPLQSLFPPLPQLPFDGSWKGAIIVLPFSFAAALITVLLFPVLLAVKRLYLHPLSRYNRPPFWAVTRLIKHKVYGDTVRVAPNEVSFINPDYPICQAPPRPGQPISILDARDADHTRLHKTYATAFSNQALTAQEPLVTGYVDTMITQLQSQTTSPTQGIDIQEWISFCTFDIVCKLSFGEDAGCLDNQRYHEWLASCRFYPWLFNYLVKRLPKSAGTLMAQHQATTQGKVKHRLQQLHSDGRTNTGGRGAAGVDQPDFLAHLVQQQCHQEISEGDIVVNAATLIVAGSHTLQTPIIGILFHVLQHSTVLSRVTSEVRGAFTSPVPLGLIRLVPTGGHTINGDFFPEGAANVSPQNYTDSMDFHLERWLKSPPFPPSSSPSSINDSFGWDKRHTTQPVLQDPRDSIGQNLARMDIVLILGKLLYHFDLQAEGRLGRWEY
ncbi:cytochrome P450 [Aspergillus novoparasiticus]|uniref:Cytochrome P450 n=1 Tax=Aspergillus novoparasiticus TaxID=986946 RepID=A0A5N6EQX3_9EURO|nr:cytochrome P450 [Aspergillus novoparasiticus]